MDSNSIIIAEGVFLYKDSLVDLFNFKVFVNVDVDLARKRFKKRKVEVGDKRPVLVFDDIWLKAFQLYCEEFKPKDKSDFILNNNEGAL